MKNAGSLVSNVYIPNPLAMMAAFIPHTAGDFSMAMYGTFLFCKAIQIEAFKTFSEQHFYKLGYAPTNMRPSAK